MQGGSDEQGTPTRSEPMSAGTRSVTWDGRDDSGTRLASGSYVVVLRSGERQESRRILVVR